MPLTIFNLILFYCLLLNEYETILISFVKNYSRGLFYQKLCQSCLSNVLEAHA